MIKPEVLDAMVAAGCTAEQIAAAVKADQSASSGAARQARYRARNKLKEGVTSDERDVTSVTVTDTVSPKKETSPTPPKEKTTPSTVSEAEASSTGSRTRFPDFWSLYPNKVGKREAETAFLKALKRADLETILVGLRRYAAKTDDRPWCNPATWLNQDRWTDQPAAVPTQRSTAPPGRRRNFADVAMDRIRSGQSGAESVFGTHGDVEFLPPGERKPRPDDEHIRGGIAGRYLAGNR